MAKTFGKSGSGHPTSAATTAPSSFPPPPSLWKRVIINLCCIYPMVIFFIWALQPIIEPYPLAGQIFVVMCIVVTLTTWIVMPNVMRLLKPWLHQN